MYTHTHTNRAQEQPARVHLCVCIYMATCTPSIEGHRHVAFMCVWERASERASERGNVHTEYWRSSGSVLISDSLAPFTTAS